MSQSVTAVAVYRAAACHAVLRDRRDRAEGPTYEWSSEEQRHRELEAIWRQVCCDADAGVAWERYGAGPNPSRTRWRSCW